MNYTIVDVETTIRNNGNPFDESNSLCLVGTTSTPYVNNPQSIYMIEYNAEPYKNNLELLQLSLDSTDVLVGFNIKFDLHWLRKYGIKFKGKRIWDCQLVHFILTGQAKSYPSLNEVAAHYGIEQKLDTVKEEYWKNGIDTPEIPKDILFDYLRQDLIVTQQVFLKQQEDIKNNIHLARLVSLHNQDLLVLEEMEYNGITYDYEWSEVLGNELEEQIDKLDTRLYQYHNHPDFNPSSNEHLSALLYGGDIKYREQVPIGEFKTGARKGETKYKWEDKILTLPRIFTPLPKSELAKEGYYSTDEATLKQLSVKSKKAEDVMSLIQTRATLEKRLTTYYRGLNKLNDEQNWRKGILHGQLNQCVARTGRLSSSKPNLQNFDGEIKSLFKTRYV